MRKKSVIIIGAGVSGLSLASYLQQCGYETRVFEKHLRPGGLCTSWQRKDYTIDGCIHWLWGSGKRSPFYKMWSEVLDINQVEFHNHKIRADIELPGVVNKYGSNVFHFYTNINSFREYLLDLAPEDKKQIDLLIKSAKRLQKFSLPPMLEKPRELFGLSEYFGFMLYTPMLFDYVRMGKQTNYQFAEKFHNPFLKTAWKYIFEGKENIMMALLMQMCIYDSHCGGFPKGGSLAFSRKIEDKSTRLGAQINYGEQVLEMIVDGETVLGVELENGQTHFADYVVSAADWRFTISKLLKDKFTDKFTEQLKSGLYDLFPSALYLALGVKKEYKNRVPITRHILPDPIILPDGDTVSRAESHVYNYDDSFAPPGKSMITVTIYTQKGQYWIDLKNNNPETYHQAKKELKDKLIDALSSKFEDLQENIELTELSTPATYHRYTGNWQGSLQGWLPKSSGSKGFPVKYRIKGLQNFYMCGHWTFPGGGLPVAVKSARDVAQLMCKEDKVSFLEK